MIRTNQPVRETEANELSETELNEVVGGIIAVMPQRAMCDGSVKPVAPSQSALIGLL